MDAFLRRERKGIYEINSACSLKATCHKRLFLTGSYRCMQKTDVHQRLLIRSTERSNYQSFFFFFFQKEIKQIDKGHQGWQSFEFTVHNCTAIPNSHVMHLCLPQPGPQIYSLPLCTSYNSVFPSHPSFIFTFWPLHRHESPALGRRKWEAAKRDCV